MQQQTPKSEAAAIILTPSACSYSGQKHGYPGLLLLAPLHSGRDGQPELARRHQYQRDGVPAPSRALLSAGPERHAVCRRLGWQRLLSRVVLPFLIRAAVAADYFFLWLMISASQCIVRSKEERPLPGAALISPARN